MYSLEQSIGKQPRSSYIGGYRGPLSNGNSAADSSIDGGDLSWPIAMSVENHTNSPLLSSVTTLTGQGGEGVDYHLFDALGSESETAILDMDGLNQVPFV